MKKSFFVKFVVVLALALNIALPLSAADTLIEGLVAVGHDCRIDLTWNPVTGVGGYNIYRADSVAGPFTKISTSLDDIAVHSDFLGTNGSTKYYYVVSVIGGIESSPSEVVSAATYAMTDDQLLTEVQETTFGYFWDFAHPVSRLSREGLTHWSEICTSGGTGMGMMTIVVGVERGFVTRTAAAERLLTMVSFLEDNVTRYHGAWPHWFHGSTGETIPFSTNDNGADLVETSYLIEGMLIVRQYFDGADACPPEKLGPPCRKRTYLNLPHATHCIILAA